jgi:hypothetical protein
MSDVARHKGDGRSLAKGDSDRMARDKSFAKTDANDASKAGIVRGAVETALNSVVDAGDVKQDDSSSRAPAIIVKSVVNVTSTFLDAHKARSAAKAESAQEEQRRDASSGVVQQGPQASAYHAVPVAESPSGAAHASGPAANGHDVAARKANAASGGERLDTGPHVKGEVMPTTSVEKADVYAGAAKRGSSGDRGMLHSDTRALAGPSGLSGEGAKQAGLGEGRPASVSIEEKRARVTGVARNRQTGIKGLIGSDPRSVARPSSMSEASSGSVRVHVKGGVSPVTSGEKNARALSAVRKKQRPTGSVPVSGAGVSTRQAGRTRGSVSGKPGPVLKTASENPPVVAGRGKSISSVAKKGVGLAGVGALAKGAADGVFDMSDESEELSGLSSAWRGGKQVVDVVRSGLRHLPGKSVTRSLTNRSARAVSKKAVRNAGRISRAEKSARALRMAQKSAQMAFSGGGGITGVIQKAVNVIHNTVRSIMSAVGAPSAGVVLACVGVVLVLMLFIAIISGAMGAMGNAANSEPNADGLPPWITQEMVIEVLRCQETYGDPAGASLAQMILESGAGEEPSGLARDDNNIYGIKWYGGYLGASEVKGYSSYETWEDTSGGYVRITASFTSFESMKDCITFRSRVMLSKSPYSTNALIVSAKETRDSDMMAEGLKDAGWATDSQYVTRLKEIMDMYGLRRFDSMTVADYQSIYSIGNGSQQAVVASATKGDMFGNGAGYCQSWVEDALVDSGVVTSKPYICCATGAWEAWGVSTSSTDIPVGALVFGHSNPRVGGGCHDDWGHVGIYIGDGKVANNRNGTTPSIDDLEWWMSAFEYKGWGWGGGIDLTERG